MFTKHNNIGTFQHNIGIILQKHLRSFIELGRKAPIEMELQQHLGEHTSKWWEIICRDAVTGNVIDGTLYGVAKRWWGTVLDKEKKPHQIELDVVAESLDKKKILIGECKWTSGEDAELRKYIKSRY